MKKIIPVILAGGLGQRLWPRSTLQTPKPCLTLVDDQYSLLQQTLLRIQHLPIEPPIVVCQEHQRVLIVQQLQAIHVHKVRMIVEPMGKNTAPAITLAALEAQSHAEEALLLVLPSDHAIQDIHAFTRTIQQAIALALAGHLVTFGIQPTRPATGYGYIRSGVDFDVMEFVEKPDLLTAQRYLDSGDYLWNSGMFLFDAALYLMELQRHRPDIYTIIQQAFVHRQQDLDFIRPDAERFSQCPAISVDYAIMEHTQCAKVVPYSGDWSDLGAWDSLYDIATKDAHQNVLVGHVEAQDTTRCFIHASTRRIVTLAVDNLVIIETEDGVLVMNKDRAQDLAG